MKFFVPLFLVFVFTTLFSNFSLYSQSITHEDTIQKKSTDIIKKVLANNKEDYFAISGGFAQVSKDKVSLLIESIESKDEIDIDRTNKSLERAKERLSDKTMNQARAQLALARAKNRLKVSNR